MKRFPQRNAPRSDYRIVSSFTDENRQRVVKLIDLDEGGRSVTNDAENVVDDILRQYANPPDSERYGCTAGVRIYYRDSMGNVDELCNDGHQFTGYAPARHITIEA